VELIVSGAYGVRGADEQILTSSCSRFSSWNTNASLGSPEYYTKQHYTRGAKCWNGPERSITVRKTLLSSLTEIDSPRSGGIRLRYR